MMMMRILSDDEEDDEKRGYLGGLGCGGGGLDTSREGWLLWGAELEPGIRIQDIGISIIIMFFFYLYFYLCFVKPECASRRSEFLLKGG